jgi:hypothetical protein
VNWRDGRRWVAVAAGVEMPTGVVLIIRPSLFVQLLFGADLSAAGQTLGRLAGFALLALAIACWPRGEAENDSISALRALLVFSLLSAVYLLYVGVRGEQVGILLWPAAALHAALTIILARVWLNRGVFRR